MDPRTISQGIERNGSVPRGTEDRFAGYAIIGLPFASGHVLSLRRFPASSVGPDIHLCGIEIPKDAGPFTRQWHRNRDARDTSAARLSKAK